MEKVKDVMAQQWYIEQTIENGWSCNVLVHHIETNRYGRQGKALTNFEKTLPSPQSDLAEQLLEDLMLSGLNHLPFGYKCDQNLDRHN